jgi:tRNA nucleotidyltransferase (CCA-adding enzyme)
VDRPGVPRSAIYRALHGVPPESLLALVAVSRSRRLRRAVGLYFGELRHVRPHVTGSDLLALGLAPGPALGAALDAVRDARLDGRANSRREELDLARRMLR